MIQKQLNEQTADVSDLGIPKKLETIIKAFDKNQDVQQRLKKLNDEYIKVNNQFIKLQQLEKEICQRGKHIHLLVVV